MTNTEYAIEVRNLKKSFKVFMDKGSTLKEIAMSKNRRKYERREVLKGISFSVERGEAIGLIGPNGCGKSTTLKLLTRIIYPDCGTIIMRGRVSSLIELGAGFHPDMSGRENIYINASIFGLSKKEIDRRLNEIIAFSELEDYIDNPVRTYSSGMYMRLAFSVAINVDADILLVDEILAVGDVNFQAKCFNRMQEIKEKGTTIVIVSHSMGQIEQICDRTIWINDGLIKAEGKPRDVHFEYLDFMGEMRRERALKEKEQQVQSNQDLQNKGKNSESICKQEISVISENNSHNIAVEKQDEDNKHRGNGDVRIETVLMSDSDDKQQFAFKTGEKVNIHVTYVVNKTVKDAIVGIGIFQKDGLRCYGTNTRIDKLESFDITENGSFVVQLINLNLLPGQYILDVAIEGGSSGMADYFRNAYSFEVYSEYEEVGIAHIDHKWYI